MATYTYEVSREHNIYPNMTVYDRFTDGVLSGWRVNANDGHAFYDTTARDTDIDPVTMEVVPVTYYYTVRGLSKYFNWVNFHLVAVPRDAEQKGWF